MQLMNSLVVFSSIPISATKLENTNPINNREQQEKTVQHDPKNKNQNQANKKPDKLRFNVATFTHTLKQG